MIMKEHKHIGSHKNLMNDSIKFYQPKKIKAFKLIKKLLLAIIPLFILITSALFLLNKLNTWLLSHSIILHESYILDFSIIISYISILLLMSHILTKE